jgi:hypothetical protein
MFSISSSLWRCRLRLAKDRPRDAGPATRRAGCPAQDTRSPYRLAADGVKRPREGALASGRYRRPVTAAASALVAETPASAAVDAGRSRRLLRFMDPSLARIPNRVLLPDLARHSLILRPFYVRKSRFPNCGITSVGLKRGLNLAALDPLWFPYILS